jgi:predicted transcriptional regulator
LLSCRHEIQLTHQALERVESWPADAQDQLAEIALDIDAGLKDVVYEPTEAELEGIDRGLQHAAEGRFATDAEPEAAFRQVLPRMNCHRLAPICYPFSSDLGCVIQRHATWITQVPSARGLYVLDAA